MNNLPPDVQEVAKAYKNRPPCMVSQQDKNKLVAELKAQGWDLGRIAAAVKSYHLATIPGLMMLGVAE